MVIKNKLLKLSSLCLVGVVTFCVIKFYPSDHKDANDGELIGEAPQSEEFQLDDGSNGENMIIDILSDAEAQNLINANVENVKNEEFLASLPDIPGLTGVKVSRSRYATLGIANVDKILNIYEKPDDSSKIVGKLVKDACCYVKSTLKQGDNEWCEIESGRVKGYVLSCYLIRGEKAITMMQKLGNYYAVTKDDIYVRKDPNSNADELFKIAGGEALQIVSIQGDWIEVKSEISENNGYIPKDYADIQFQMKQASKGEDLQSAYSSIGMSSKRTAILNLAYDTIGTPYVYRGTNLNTGVDCSGFVLSVYKKCAGIDLPRTAAQQSRCGKSVPESELKPGDLVFYNDGGSVGHVAIYVGEDSKGVKKIIHAPYPGERVKTANMAYSPNRFYRRILN